MILPALSTVKLQKPLVAVAARSPAESGKEDPMVMRRVCQVRHGSVVAVIVGAALVTSCGGGGTTEESATSQGQVEETTVTTPAPAKPTTATSPAPTAAASTTVTAALTEFSIKLSQQTFAPGSYEFVAEEQGQLPHALSTEGPGVDNTSTAVIQPGGDSQTLTVTLQPGTYETSCPVGNHRAKGMETTITVG